MGGRSMLRCQLKQLGLHSGRLDDSALDAAGGGD